MIRVYRKLRGTGKVEFVGAFHSIEDADDVVFANNDPTGCWLYFREQTEEEKNEDRP